MAASCCSASAWRAAASSRAFSACNRSALAWRVLASPPAASPLLPASAAGLLPVAKEVPRRSAARPAWWRSSLLLCSSLYPNRRENPRQGRVRSTGVRLLTACNGHPNEGFLLNHYQPAPLFTFCDPGQPVTLFSFAMQRGAPSGSTIHRPRSRGEFNSTVLRSCTCRGERSSTVRVRVEA